MCVRVCVCVCVCVLQLYFSLDVYISTGHHLVHKIFLKEQSHLLRLKRHFFDNNIKAITILHHKHHTRILMISLTRYPSVGFSDANVAAISEGICLEERHVRKSLMRFN